LLLLKQIKAVFVNAVFGTCCTEKARIFPSLVWVSWYSWDSHLLMWVSFI